MCCCPGPDTAVTSDQSSRPMFSVGDDDPSNNRLPVSSAAELVQTADNSLLAPTEISRTDNYTPASPAVNADSAAVDDGKLSVAKSQPLVTDPAANVTTPTMHKSASK